MMNDAKLDDPTVSDDSIRAEDAEASFPAPEEVRSSYTSRNDVAKPSKKRKTAWIVGICLFMLAIVVSTVALSQRSDGGRAEIGRVATYLSSEDVSVSSAFDDTSSPQYLAARWLALKDTAALAIPDAETTSTERYMYMFRYVMAVHYFALGGDEWTANLKFLSSANVCEWKSLRYGVLCRVINGQEVPSELVLARNNAQGQLPAEIGKLTTLEGINIGHNKLTGSIPPALCFLSNLRYITLNENMLQGSIPECVGSLSQLIDLTLSDNVLEGSLPNTLGKLKNMKQFYIDDNTFSGNPITVLNQLTGLTHLRANGNNFAGAIDSTFLSKSPKINWVDLSHNKFTSVDEFPTSVFSLPIYALDLSKNELAGTFPSTIATNTRLEFLSLFGNKLTGPVSSLASLEGMKHLDLSSNRFTGSMQSIGSLSKLTFLFLSENPFFQGPVPPAFSTLSNLTELSLRNTNRNGRLPLLVKQVQLLDLGSNQLSGEIPPSYGYPSNISYLLLNNNTGITGSIPASFARMTTLRGVFLDGTSLSNNTMSTLCGFSKFKTVDKKYDEVLVGDCLSCTCSGCQCCLPGLKGGCSRPLLGNIDASWESHFRRVKYEMRNITADLENAVRPH